MKPVGVVLVGVVLAVLMTVAGVAGGLVVILQTRAQSVRNQRHTDCIISVFTRTDPPACRSIVAQLQRDGIFPTTTTTGAP